MKKDNDGKVDDPKAKAKPIKMESVGDPITIFEKAKNISEADEHERKLICKRFHTEVILQYKFFILECHVYFSEKEVPPQTSPKSSGIHCLHHSVFYFLLEVEGTNNLEAGINDFD